MHRTLVPAVVACLLAVLVTPVAHATAADRAADRAGDRARRAPARQIDYTAWTGTELGTGAASGVRVRHGHLVLDAPHVHRRYDHRRYDMGRWSSPWTEPGFGLTQLVASWSARTPADSWIEVRVRGRDATGTTSTWDTLGRWAAQDTHVQRTTVSGQDDDLASVNVDTWQAHAAAGLVAFQLQVRLMRAVGATTRSPRIDALGAMASRLPSGSTPTSAPGPGRGIVLDVPRYSQMVHDGHYPQYGGGGEAWCSPTSTSMVLGYYGALRRASSYTWVPKGHVDPWVDQAARMTYDAAYQGTGNWPFNTAYAARLAGHAFVTRLRSLREAERFIVAGIPVVTSISFGAGELSGAPISASNGHLVVVVGFTDGGDVVVNDPAAQSRSGVRRTYDRGEFENAWLPTSGGLAYVITDDAHPLPGGTPTNW